MRKIFLLITILTLIILTFLGCDLLGVTGLSPPGWILGTWSGIFSDDNYQFQFTSDNVILTIGDVPRNFKVTYTSISESSSSTTYTINATEVDGSSTTYEFTKITEEILNCAITANWLTIPLLVLNKK